MINNYHAPHLGRIEIKNQTSDIWGTVSGYRFSKKAAKVICRAMGFRGVVLSLANNRTFGSGSGPVYIGGLKCTGKEEDILDCAHDGWENPRYNHKYDAAVWCTEKRVSSE